MANDTDFDESDLKERFILSAGPGGQNVNKVATAVELRIALDALRRLDPDARERLRQLAGSRLTQDGEIVIVARRYRSQERNRQDARSRLIALIERAKKRERTRKKTRKPGSANRQRLESKKRRGEKKRLRGKPPLD